MIRYRFSEFTLSPQRRLLVRAGQEVPLIPRYFDLLLLLIERRREAVHRREIFDSVWTDVTVSDSALSQAVRTIRSALGDDWREPRFIRTVSRHGYRFVFPDVIEEEDDAAWPVERPVDAAGASTGAPPGSLAGPDGSMDGTTAPTIPLFPVERATQLAAKRWPAAAAGAALAGVAAGGAGGLILAAAPGSTAPIAIAPVLAAIGGACGAIGGAGVGLGLALAEAGGHSRRFVAMVVAGALGGGVVGLAVEWLARWGLAALIGVDLDVGGGLEGVVIGASAGLGFAIATRQTPDLLPAPRSRTALQAALITGVACGLAGLLLTLTGRPLASGTIHAFAHAASGSRATLAPLGRLIGEPDFGPVSGSILAFCEGGLFGLGLAFGLLRRPRGVPDPVSFRF